MSFTYLREMIDGEQLVKGFVCSIHGGNAFYAKPVKEADVLKCPSCGHPICPVCANAYSTDPKTAEQAIQYLDTCDSVSGAAWCGQCGDYGREFMERFLKLVGCEMPKLTVKPDPVRPRVVVTASLAVLPGIDKIATAACEKFMEGSRAMQTIPHSTGEILAVPDRYPDEWVLTLCRPEER